MMTIIHALKMSIHNFLSRISQYGKGALRIHRFFSFFYKLPSCRCSRKVSLSHSRAASLLSKHKRSRLTYTTPQNQQQQKKQKNIIKKRESKSWIFNFSTLHFPPSFFHRSHFIQFRYICINGESAHMISCMNDEWGEFAYVTVNRMGGMRRPFITVRIDMRREKDGSRMFDVIFWVWILSTFFFIWRVSVWIVKSAVLDC